MEVTEWGAFVVEDGEVFGGKRGGGDCRDMRQCAGGSDGVGHVRPAGEVSHTPSAFTVAAPPNRAITNPSSNVRRVGRSKVSCDLSLS